jgi:peptidyl-prolyl cis-trans isomerase C
MIQSKKGKLLSIVAGLFIASSLMANDDKVYAVVNGDNITGKDLATIIRDPRVKFDDLKADQKKKVLDTLIEQKLLANRAYKTDIVKTKEYKSELEKFKRTLAFQIWLRDYGKEMKATDKEVKKYYDNNIYRLKTPLQLKASHILVKTEKEAQSIINELGKSKNLKADFTKLAKEKSIGPSGSNGGELGWFTKEKMVPEFSSAAEELKIGKLTQKPVKTNYGFHIIYLDDKKEAATLPYEKIKDKLKQELLQKKFADQVKKEAKELRKTAKIEYK